MAGKATVNIKFLADLQQFSTQMQNASRSLKKMGKQLQGLGTTLSVGVTAPFVAFSALSLKNWDTQEKAVAQVEAGLVSVGDAVGYTSKELQKMASDLQNNSLFGDEEILQGVTAQLLTFTNIANDEFARTQKVALDLATRLGGDLKGASIQLGKALNDPLANLSALSRSGIQFSEDQKATIKTFAETNRLADAQKVILSELEKQYGGSAAAAAKAGTGPFKQLANSIGDLSEEFGKIIAEFLLPFVDKIKGLVAGFQALSPNVKKFIVVLGGIAAAAGPLLLLAGTILPAIASGFAILTGPIGLIVAGLTAVGVVIYKNWKPIKKTLVSIANYFIDLYNESTVFRIAVEGVVLQFKNIWSVAKFVFSAVKNIIVSFVNGFIDRFKMIGAIIKAVFTGEFSKIPEIVKGFGAQSLKGFSKLGSDLKADWAGLMVDVSANTRQAIENIGKRAKIKVLEENVDVSAVEKVVKNTFKGGKTGRRKEGDILADKRGEDGKVEQSFDLGIAKGISVEGEQVKTELQGITDDLESFQEMAEQIALTVAGGFEDMGVRMIDSLNLADTGFEGFVKNLGKTIVKLISMLLANALANAITSSSQSALAMGPGAVFALPAFITTAVSGVVAAFAAIPKFEYGGIVGGSSFYGDKILARVNSGELILNQKQQQRLYGMITPVAQSVNVHLVGELTTDMHRLSVGLKKEEKRKYRTT